MCGILGQVGDYRKHSLLPQLKELHHRGPDGRGEWTSESCDIYFGHTRLAILEPTPAGAQPMQNASGRFTITFNGEIYNHLELRSLLPSIHWHGNSDTETLIELLSYMGVDALPLLKGMFAFALHDATDDSVLLVRDRLGIKPLWLRCHKDIFTFASEVRPLLKVGEGMPNKQALSEYIGFGRLPGSGEILAGLQAVPPGNWIKIKGNKIVIKEAWWPQSNFTQPKIRTGKEHVVQVKQLVTTAIESHLISDVGVGAFLSGGIDSSIIALVAGKMLGPRLQTFTVGFPQSAYDERLIARKVAKAAKSDHYELEVSEDDCLHSVMEAVNSLDLPSVDAINTFIVSKAVRDTGLKVALSGLGGDELFGGYPSFKDIPLLKRLSVLPTGIRNHLINIMPGKLKEKLNGITFFDTTTLTIARRRLTSVAHLKRIGLDDGNPVIPPAPKGLDTMGTISWGEIHGYMIPMLLRDSDQMSMAVGLEIRVPFLDHQLVEEVLSIPQKFKKGRGVKPLLVEAFQSELLPEIFNRPKQGFALPMDQWMRGPLHSFTKEGVQAAADALGFAEPIKQLQNFTAGKLHWARVWNWCVLGHWIIGQKTAKMNESYQAAYDKVG